MTAPRAVWLRAPLLLGLWVLLAVEAVGGLVIFTARLVGGGEPGVFVHTAAGVALAGIYAIYQWNHWRRVRPVRPRLDYTLGLIAAFSMAATLATGLVLGWIWWRDTRAARVVEAGYPPLLTAAHDIGSMLVLTFAGAHLGAVLMRDRVRAAGPSARERPEP